MRRILVLSLIGLCVATCTCAQAPATKSTAKDSLMSLHAEGTFEVKNTPLGADDALNGTAVGRFGLDKQFKGDLEGTSKGEMLGAGNPATGTAGYVAIEQVTGALSGKSGSFALQHFGTMEENKFDLLVKVVPGSGTAAAVRKTQRCCDRVQEPTSGPGCSSLRWCRSRNPVRSALAS